MTVVELVVTTALLLVIVTSMMTFFSVAQRTTVRQTARSQEADEVRLVMNRLTKELRQAEEVNSSSSISILDFDTYVNAVAKHIVYQVSGTDLLRTADGITRTVLQRLTNTTPFCCDLSAGPSTVIITLEAHPEHFHTDTGDISLTSEVKLRNRG
jgi:hypothetical protein